MAKTQNGPGTTAGQGQQGQQAGGGSQTADAPQNGGGQGQQGQNQPQQPQQPGQNQPHDQGNQQQQSQQRRQKVDFTPAQQQKLNEIIAETIRKEREAAEEQAEAARLAEQGKYQDLYAREQTKVKALEAKVNALEPLAAEINSAIDEESAEWPDEIKLMDPGKDNAAARYRWATNARKVVAQLTGNGQSKKPDAPNAEAGQQQNGNRTFSRAGEAPRQNGQPTGQQQQPQQPGQQRPTGSSERYRFQGPNDVKW